MRAAGIRQFGANIELLDLPAPGAPAPDEVVIRVVAAGVGNWDDLVRQGRWDVGAPPPLALGVEAAGIIERVGPAVRGFAPGARVLTHPLPLRGQGTWAELLLAPAPLLAPVPAVRGAEAATLAAVRDGGRFCTITGGPPPAQRGIRIRNLYVAPDGPRLAHLAELAAQDQLHIRLGPQLPLERAAQALAVAVNGGGGAVALLIAPEVVR